MKEGVITGCDRRQEWLLAWWWSHYSIHNSYPVLFLDFGMSGEAVRWCAERGECISLRQPPFRLSAPADVDPRLRDGWEECYGTGVWARRAVWFKKPFALQMNPFDVAVWIDLDCEVRASLDPLFLCLHLGAGLALARETAHLTALHRLKGFLHEDEIEYNAGVIAFQQHAPLLERWREEVIERNALFLSDQPALSRAIYRNSQGFMELPRAFNWNAGEENPDAAIVHYQGDRMKQELFLRVKDARIDRGV